MLAMVGRVKDSSRTESLRSPLCAWHGNGVDHDWARLRALDERFIAACRAGSWQRLGDVDEDFRYLNGRTGQTWDWARYVVAVQADPSPSLRSSEPVIHGTGQTATVSARARRDDRPGRADRYRDSGARRDGRWWCVPACVWPLAPGDGAG
jgi:hypothetical protein